MVEDTVFLQSIAVDATTINRINKLPSLLSKRDHYIREFLFDYLEHLKTEYNILHEAFPDVDITPYARIKSYSSYYNKAVRVAGLSSFKDIYDIFANRYVINSINGSTSDKHIIPVLYKIRDFLCIVFGDVENVDDRIKDYILNPKEDDYQALHITRYHKNNKFYTSETQLRSASMDECARLGTASHANIYKKRVPGKTSVPLYLEYVFDDNGFCTLVEQMDYEKAFEYFFGIPYNPDLHSIADCEKLY